MRTSRAMIKLIGEETIDVEASFDSGAVDSLISFDLAMKLGEIFDLPQDEEYSTVKKGEKIRVIGHSRASVRFDGCKTPPAFFAVSPDLVKEKVIIGRPHLDQWGVILDEEPRLKRCPIELEI